MTFPMFDREININRDGRMWMSSSGGHGKLKQEMLMLVVCGSRIGSV